ncbi:hypothetical protein LOZ58_003433 [Ophidiomyces ophidiicola]|nr:hypothetical protein LOZ58_003433 [Ophidiomyces ophidiicola]
MSLSSSNPCFEPSTTATTTSIAGPESAAIIAPSNKVSSFLKIPRHLPILRTHHSYPETNMPLVVPEVNENDQAAWAAKLMGKKLTDGVTDNVSFAKKDLPEQHRILKPGDFTTMDYIPDRLNVYVDESETVTDVKHG